MTTLARADPPRELAATAFELYETFRPAVTEGRRPPARGFRLGGSAASAARSVITCGNRGKQAGINNRE